MLAFSSTSPAGDEKQITTPQVEVAALPPLSTSAQRQWLEATATSTVLSLIGIEPTAPDEVNVVVTADDKKARTRKRTASDGVQTSVDLQQKRRKLETPATTTANPTTIDPPVSSVNAAATSTTPPGPSDEIMITALTSFVNRLPLGAGAHLCIEDLLSFIRNAKPSRASLLTWLNQPPFTNTLAAFGKLKDHPFILCFDPWSGLPGPLSIIPDEEPVTDEQLAAAVGGTTDSAAESLAAHRRQLEALELELVQTFNEEFRPTGMSCKKCGEQRFLNVSNEQRRSSDEGSGSRISCGLCGDVSRSR